MMNLRLAFTACGTAATPGRAHLELFIPLRDMGRLVTSLKEDVYSNTLPLEHGMDGRFCCIAIDDRYYNTGFS